MLSSGARRALSLGVEEQINRVKKHVDYLNDPYAIEGMKVSLLTIENEIDEIEETIHLMKYNLYYSYTDKLTNKLNQIKETVQMTISCEVI